MDPLQAIIDQVVSTPVLLVATDFDGTLSPLIEEFDRPLPSRHAMAALERMAALANTRVAVVSGRGLVDLQARIGVHRGWEYCGSHGAEIAGERVDPIGPESARQISRIRERLDALAREHPGSAVERKSRGVAFHYRGTEESRVARLESALLELSRNAHGLCVRTGSCVVEYQVDTLTKADGLRRIQERTHATAVLFIGDDRTDEDAFRALGPADAGVKVGAGPTAARFRVEGIAAVEALLARLADERRARAPVESPRTVEGERA